MAEGCDSQPVTPVWSKDIFCRYYLHGVCREGESCRYSHDRSAQASMVCRFYLKGNCTYGDKCRYDHIKPQKDVSKHQPSNKISSNDVNPKSAVSNSHKPPPFSSSCNADFKSNMVSLKKGVAPSPQPQVTLSSVGKPAEEWVKAKEFVPGQPYEGAVPSSYAKAAMVGKPDEEDISFGDDDSLYETTDNSKLLCPFAAHGECWYGDNCEYLHGNICDLCGLAVLHPDEPEQQEQHRKECIERHEKDMELSFAIARSKDKACGICMDVVVEKNPVSERRFGILPGCNHCFCLSCIRKWRCAKQFENKIIRACPECRVQSDFVTPSQYWYETKEDKEKLIEGYKGALSSKPCRYFDQGRGECPFNEKCFYLHAYPDGRIAEPQPRKVRRRRNADGETDIVRRISLWDFFEERDMRHNLWILEEEFLSHLLLDIMLDSESSSDSDDLW
ncbi:probable E3 ubiquitin-protein ligase makorin-1 [Haliotis asinina]|uniref:probable E3 ubiquitin-protein ligase makorin-1 n=1 Tax=Haliotis asinina TaxID=109174 RepID=UPI0035322AFF